MQKSPSMYVGCSYTAKNPKRVTAMKRIHSLDDVAEKLCIVSKILLYQLLFWCQFLSSNLSSSLLPASIFPPVPYGHKQGEEERHAVQMREVSVVCPKQFQ